MLQLKLEFREYKEIVLRQKDFRNDIDKLEDFEGDKLKKCPKCSKMGLQVYEEMDEEGKVWREIRCLSCGFRALLYDE